MTLKELELEHKEIDEQLIACIQCTIKTKDELHPIFDRLTQHCEKYKCGPVFAIYYWLTGEEKIVEVCVPVTRTIETNEIKSRTLEGVNVISFVLKDPITNERLNEFLAKTFQYMREHGIAVAERRREIYLDANNPEGNEIEYQIVIHNWNNLLVTNMERVLGKKLSQEVMQDIQELTPESNNDERIQWIKTMLERIDEVTDDHQKYEIISRCAHIFPKEEIKRLKDEYEKIINQTNDSLRAIDGVLKAMQENKQWFPDPPRFREGRNIISEKCPVNPKAYEKAKNEAERRKAYCYCPIIRNYLEEEIIPHSFCNCSAGWERQVWEGIFKTPVRVEVVKSLVQGDETCQFIIHIPEEL
ncbi:MAG: DUF6144 family protein [Candidatus Hodarchaeales archaeon]|jgi:hypothetical protein